MKLFHLMEAIQDMVDDAHRERISNEELSVCCNNLAQKIQKSFRPDIIIAIATGGSTTGELVAETLNIPVIHITIRRDIDRDSYVYKCNPVPLRWVISLYQHYLFRTRKPRVSGIIHIDVSNKKVLIVDDTIHTGATVDVAVNYLKNAGSLEIRTASLAYVSKRKPDFLYFRGGTIVFHGQETFKSTTNFLLIQISKAIFFYRL